MIHSGCNKGMKCFGNNSYVIANLLLVCFILLLIAACGDSSRAERAIDLAPITIAPEENKVKIVNEQIPEILSELLAANGKINDSVSLKEVELLQIAYASGKALWMNDSSFLPIADTILLYLQEPWAFGLSPAVFHAPFIAARYREAQLPNQKDATKIALADVLLTHGFIQMNKKLMYGPLPFDSVKSAQWNQQSKDLIQNWCDQVRQNQNWLSLLQTLEPKHVLFQTYKEGLNTFLSQQTVVPSTVVPYPIADTVQFKQLLAKRLWELGYLSDYKNWGDTAVVKRAILHFQQTNKLDADGKVGPQFVSAINDAIYVQWLKWSVNLHKSRNRTDSMPLKYAWVNLPSYYLEVIDQSLDTPLLRSKVIVGAVKTPTPELTSTINQFITSPQWVVPYSIIFKEMLPAIRRNINYLSKNNLEVVNKYDSIIAPSSIDWNKLSPTYFPYLIRQRSGDGNSLGVMKFNFYNKYSVYLHDTNARYLFEKTNRALSHGCVRVKEWKSLAALLLQQDSTQLTNMDSVSNWIQKQNRVTVRIKPGLPLFITYFTIWPSKDGSFASYSDIYGRDQRLYAYFIKP